MPSRKLFTFFFAVFFFGGVAALSNVFGNPRFATIRAVDMVHLIAVGLCFGAALMALVARLKSGLKE
jgi:hypothetical protein